MNKKVQYSMWFFLIACNLSPHPKCGTRSSAPGRHPLAKGFAKGQLLSAAPRCCGARCTLHAAQVHTTTAAALAARIKTHTYTYSLLQLHAHLAALIMVSAMATVVPLAATSIIGTVGCTIPFLSPSRFETRRSTTHARALHRLSRTHTSAVRTHPRAVRTHPLHLAASRIRVLSSAAQLHFSHAACLSRDSCLALQFFSAESSPIGCASAPRCRPPCSLSRSSAALCARS